jgi:hypothetical protein
MDTLITATSAIIELAFNEFIKSGASELSKTLLSGTKRLCEQLQDKIRNKLQGNSRAEAALSNLEQQGNSSAIDKVAKYLDIEMVEDPMFSAEIQQMVQEIVTINNRQQISITGDSNKVIQFQIQNGTIAVGSHNQALEEDFYHPKKIEEESNLLHLENLLHQGKWLEADRETWRSMLRIKKRDDWLRDEDLVYFPCPELQQIDKLWRESSGGKFGFRVQWDIFVRCISSSNIDSRWDEFEQKVGWKKKSFFSSYGERTNPVRIDENSFDFQSSPQGYLPYSAVCLFETVNPSILLTHPPSDGLPRRLIYLGWRLLNCEIK